MESYTTLSAQLSALVDATCQTLETLFERAAEGQPEGAMLVLDKNAGSFGIDCLGGLRRGQGTLMVCFRRSRQGIAAPAVAIAILLSIVGQLESKAYTFEAAK